MVVSGWVGASDVVTCEWWMVNVDGVLHDDVVVSGVVDVVVCMVYFVVECVLMGLVYVIVVLGGTDSFLV